MMKILILSILFYSAGHLCSASVYEEPDFLYNLINLSFNRPFCLYFIWDHLHNEGILSQILKNRIFQIVSLEVTKTYLIRHRNFICDGYILDSIGHNSTINLFESETINLHFQPHKRVLLFTNNLQYFNSSTVKAAVDIHDLDLIIIEIKLENNNESDIKFKWIHHDNIKEKVTNVISVRSQKSYITTDKTFFLKQKWIPERILKKYDRNFSISLFHCPPYISFDNRNLVFEGMEIEMLNQIAKNWPIHLIYLKKAQNESSRNLFKEAFDNVESNKCDIAMCDQIQHKPHPDSEQTRYYVYFCFKFLVYKPELLPNSNFIVQPLELSLWLIYFATLLVFALLLNLTLNSCRNWENLFLMIINVIKVSAGSSLNDVKSVYKLAEKFISLNLLIFGMLMVTVYSSGLAMSLQFPRFSISPNNIDEMIKYKVNWQTSHNISLLKKYIENTNTATVSKLARLYKTYKNATEAVEKLRAEKQGLIVSVVSGSKYAMFAEKLENYEKNHMRVMLNNVGCFYGAFPMKMNSPYLQIFDKAIGDFIEFGFFSYWLRIFEQKKENRFMELFFEQFHEDKLQTINLNKAQNIFYFLLFGNSLGLIVLLLEIIWKKKITKFQISNSSEV